MRLSKKIQILALTAAAFTAAAAQNILSVRDTITDPYLVYPESYEADTHQLRTNWYMQNYIALDNGESPSADKPVSEEELISRLMAMPTVIEMPYNQIVRSYIDMYVHNRRELVENMLGMSTYYMPIFEEALDAEGMPLELKYLPIVESALNPNAVSRAGATGLWQFMLPTARGLGMEINSLVDQRRDPYVSSRMAARYLKQLHDIYGDWSLAIAAYNCGPGKVNSALRMAGEGKKDFWDIYHYLPAETRGYVPVFIAANYVMNYYDKHNISPALAKKPIITDTVSVHKRVNFQQISDVLDISVDALRILNPQYRQDVIPGDIRPYTLVLPSFQALSYAISEDSIANHNIAAYQRRGVVDPNAGNTRLSDDGKYMLTDEIIYHKVAKGDTFSKLAKRYGVTAGSIKKANGIKTLRRGRTIRIVRTVKTPVPEQPRPDTEADADSQITPADSEVKQPEGSIVTGDSIINVNDSVPIIHSSVIPSDAAGTPVQPEAKEADAEEQPKVTEPEKPVEPKKVYHTVRRGETLSKIAARYGTTVKKIQQLNPSIKGTRINAKQRIRVK